MPPPTAKQRALGRRLRLHTLGSAVVGALANVLVALLIAYAIIDIEYCLWAQWLYTVVYAASALMFGSAAGAAFLPEACVQRTVVLLCCSTAVLAHWAPLLLRASWEVRVSGLALLGTGLGASLLLSAVVMLQLSLELRGVLPKGSSVEEGMLNARQLALLGFCALIEGGYFGLAIGFLQRGQTSHFIALPHQAPAAVFSFAFSLGAAAGTALEILRQRSDVAYIRGIELQIMGGTSTAAADSESSALLSEVEKDA